MPKFQVGDIVVDSGGTPATIASIHTDIFGTEYYNLEVQGTTITEIVAVIDKDCTLLSGIPAPSLQYQLPLMPPPPPVNPVISNWAQQLQDALAETKKLRTGYEPIKHSKCTCGSDAVRSPMHSTWCDKIKAS